MAKDKAPPHVLQAQGELANARAYGQAGQAAEKRLAAAGVTPERAADARRKAADESPEPGRQRTAAPQGRTTAPRVTTDNAAIREWAAHAGYDVSARGKIPDDVVAAYNQAHGGQ
jgi:hypothetical protein